MPSSPTITVLFLSTGTGEAPHNYMLWELLKRNHRGKMLAACCVRYRRDLGYLATQEELMRRYPHYTYLPLTDARAEQRRRQSLHPGLAHERLSWSSGWANR